MQLVKFKQRSFLLGVCSLVLLGAAVGGCSNSNLHSNSNPNSNSNLHSNSSLNSNSNSYYDSGRAVAAVPSTPAPVFQVDKPKEKRGRRFKLNLTLDQPSDLKVNKGDRIIAGQTVAQKELTEQQRLARLQLVTQINSVERLPQEFYLVQANQEVELVQARLKNYLDSSPFTDTYEPISRMVKRQELEANLAAAANKRNAVLSQLEIARQEAKLKKDQLALQLRTLDASLEQLKVKSPYTGTIRRVKVERGSNRQLAVTLTIQTNDLE